MNGFSQVLTFYLNIINNILYFFPTEIHWLIILLILGATLSALAAIFQFVKDKILLVVIIVILIPSVAPLLVALLSELFNWLMR